MTNPAAPSEDWANALTDFVDEIGGDGPGLWKWAGITPTPKEVVDELRLLFKHSEQRATASGARSVLKFDPQDSDESIRLAWGDMTPDQAVKGLKALVGHLNGLAAPPVPQTSAPGAEFLRPTMDEVMGLAKMFGVEVNDCHALMWLVVTSIAAWGDGPEPTSTAPVAWCRSDEFAQFAQGREYLLAFSEQHPNCDMALYAQPWASAAPGADQAEGPSLADVYELCVEFKFHPDADNGEGLAVLHDIIAAAITRWRAPVVEPVPVKPEIEPVGEWPTDQELASFLADRHRTRMENESAFGCPDFGGAKAKAAQIADVRAAITRWRAPVAEPVAAQDTEVDWKSMTARMDFGMAKPSKPVAPPAIEISDEAVAGVRAVLLRLAQPANPSALPAQGEVEELIAALEADAECVAAEQPDLMRLTDKQLTRIAQLLKGTTHA